MMTTNARPSSSARRTRGLLLAAALAVTVGACTGAARPAPSGPVAGSHQDSPILPTGTSTGDAGGVAIAPAPAGQGTSGGAMVGPGVAGGGSGTANAGSSIAYPYPIYGGSPGVAPDHSILVTGTGQADLRNDGSNRAAAERTALAAAVADARARANQVAAATGVSIQGVLSVSVSVGQTWISPLGLESSGGKAVAPTEPTGPQPAPPVAATPQLQVTVTIAYTIG